MTLANTDDRSGPYAGNGSQTQFAFSFRAVEDSSVKVYKDDVLLVSGVKVKRNISGVGGTVTLTPAPANGTEILILRESDYLQQSALGVNETFNPKTVESAIDKAMIAAQQLNTALLSALRFAKSIDLNLVSPELPAPEPSMLLGWNPEATGLRNVSPLQAFNEFVEPGDGFSGDVFGPADSVIGEIAVFSDTTGKELSRGPAPGPAGNLCTSDGVKWVSSAPAETADVILPSGMVIPFLSASHIPPGFEPCDGRTVTVNGASFITPDTRGKYFMCASLNDSGSAGYTGAGVVAGAIAGQKVHAHTQQGTFATTNATPGINVPVASGFGANVKGPNALTHNHNVTISGPTQDHAESSRPLSVAVILAIKVDE